MSDELMELPEGWEWSNIGTIAHSMQNGIYKAAQFYNDSGIACLRMYNIENGEIVWKEIKRMILTDQEVEQYKLMPGDILINRVNSRELVGKAASIPVDLETCIYESKNIRLRLFQELTESKFVSSWFRIYSQKYFNQNAQQTVGMASINQEQIGLMPIPLPPLNEQKRIVAAIETLRERSQKARSALSAIPELCDKFRQSVLAAAFRGDLTADWREQNPDVEPASALLERIRRDRRKQWEQIEIERLKARGKILADSKWKEKYEEPKSVRELDLLDIPPTWCWAKWEQVGLCQNGRAFPSKEYQAEGVKLLRPGNLHISGKVEWNESNTKFMSEAWATEYPDYLIGSNELIINLTAQSLADEFLGRVCLTGENEICLLNQRIARLTPVGISTQFLLWLFKSKLFRHYVDDLNTGSLIQHMFTSQIDEFYFPLPSLEEQEAIVQEIEVRIKSVESMKRSSKEIFEIIPGLDRSTLAKAFRGELVEQDPNDEPASVLLDRIRVDREQQMQGKIKKLGKKKRTGD